MLWEPRATDARDSAPFGEFKFTLIAPAEAPGLRRDPSTPLCTATVYAAHGLPSDDLEEAWSCAPTSRTLELFDIETTFLERRRGYASTLLAALREEVLPIVAPDVRVLWAKDASGIEGIYDRWGFEARDDEYPHVYALDLGAKT